MQIFKVEWCRAFYGQVRTQNQKYIICFVVLDLHKNLIPWRFFCFPNLTKKWGENPIIHFRYLNFSKSILACINLREAQRWPLKIKVTIKNLWSIWFRMDLLWFSRCPWIPLWYRRGLWAPPLNPYCKKE